MKDKFMKDKFMKDKFYYSDGSILDHYDETKTLHREGAPTMELADGSQKWYLNGKRHREGAPAIEFTNGDKYWFLNGEVHREDGPAVELTNGYRAWFLNGVHYTEEEYHQEMNRINNLPNILKLVDPRAWVRAKYQGEVHEG